MENKYHINNIGLYNVQIIQFMTQCYIKEEPINILEIGCNEGRNLYTLNKMFPNSKIYGTDILQDAIKSIRQNIPNGNFIINNIEQFDLPYEQKFFDAILFVDVLEHLYKPKEVLDYIKKFLKPNGKIFCSIPNLTHFTVMWNLIKKNKFSYTKTGLLDSAHIHLFTYLECLNMFYSCGYNIKKNISSILMQPAKEAEEFIDKLVDLSQIKFFTKEEIKQLYYSFSFNFILEKDN